MILDAASPQRSAFGAAFDVCVVGSGPAGITLARRLAAAGASVALMEGGEDDFTSESQDLYYGRNVGLDYLAPEVSRLRYLGGTSNHWGGGCYELDDHDFVPRPHHPFSGWPIAKSDLDPYQAEADSILNLDGPPGFSDHPLRRANDDFRRIRYRHAPTPVRFGQRFRREIEASERIHLALNANLVDLRLDEALGTVSEARFRSLEPGDPGFAVRARSYALCAGGLENPRILLNARSQIPAGIGNGHDLVGRFFCEHPHIEVGEALFQDRILDKEYYAPTRAFLEANEVLHFCMAIRNARPHGMEPLWLPKEIVREAACLAPFTERLARQVTGPSLTCDGGLGVGAYLARRAMPEDFLGSVVLQAEQALDPASRVRLGDERDALGLNRLELDWRLSDLDRRTARAAVLNFAMLLAQQEIGRMRVAEWLLEDDWDAGNATGKVTGSYHHMCTTRMSDDPRHGVVDRDCRVHGLSNLYVGGSSVFATAGHARPTYTIVKLSLRLADHLGEELLA